MHQVEFLFQPLKGRIDSSRKQIYFLFWHGSSGTVLSYQRESAYTPLTSSPHTTSLMISRQRHSLAFSKQLQKPKPSLSAFYTVWFFTVWFYTLLFCTLFPHSPPPHSLSLHSLIFSCSTWLSTQLTLSPAAALELQPHLFSHLAGTLSS